MSRTRAGRFAPRFVALGALACAAVLGACGGDSPTEPPPGGSRTGSLALTISGLPSGTTASVTVAATGFSKTVTASGTLRDLAPGTYTVTAANVETADQTYVPEPATQQVSVAAGASAATATVAYAPSTASLAVSISGLPAGANGAVTVTGPGSFTRTLTATTTMSGLQPGTYTVSAAAVTSGSKTYDPSPVSQSVDLTASLVATSAVVTYAEQVTTGSIRLAVDGLPEGGGGSYRLLDGDGAVLSEGEVIQGTTQDVTDLQPGTYTLSWSAMAVGTYQQHRIYEPTPASKQLTVTASSTPEDGAVTYALATGEIALSVAGLPAGEKAHYTIRDADDRAVSSGDVLQGATVHVMPLRPGSYTVTWDDRGSYVPSPRTTNVTVTATLTPVPVAVTYSTP